MKLTNKRELYSAGLMMLIGIGTTIGSLNYDLGTLSRMGPGYFPLILGVLLMFISGLIIAAPHKEKNEEIESSRKGQYRSWVIVTTGILTFMLFGKYGGLVPATFTLVFISAFADRANSIKSALALATGVTITAVGVFHYAMKLQFPLFTWG